ncbi:MAG: 50S ribosomal protein L9 [Parcubacteria group bacterium]
MKVVFLQNVKGTAQAGDIKDVSSGYARNHLIPEGIARIANVDAMSQAKSLQKKREVNREEQIKWAKEIVSKAADLKLEFEMEASEEGSLYGSLDARKIAESASEKGLKIKPEDLKLEHPIKEIGEHSVELDLPGEEKASILLTVKRRSLS